MKHISKLFLLTGVICFYSLCAKSQTAAAPATVKKTTVKLPVAGKTPVSIIDTFFKKIKSDGTDPAIDYLFGTNKLFNNVAQINLLKIKLDSLQRSVGQYVGHELIAQKSAGTSLVFYSYLAKFTVQPIRFTFMFYKAQTDWVLYRFKYDDQMDLELEEAGKINNKRAQ